MNSRERVLTTLRHEEPDRVPFSLRPATVHWQRLRAELGTSAVDLPAHFGHDLRFVRFQVPRRPDDVPVAEWTPRPADEAVRDCAARVQELHAAGVAACGDYICGVFEQAKDWVGDAAALTLPYEEPDRFAALLDRITEWKMALYGAYVAAGVDVVWMGDDLGTQRSLIMSPRDYRTWYRPRHERIIAHLRSIRADVRIAFHSCGYVIPLIPDLIETGIDILEALQAEVMDIAQLKREFGRDLSLWGGIGTQSVFARTTPADVAEGVRDALRILAPGGGYIAAPCQMLTDEVPWEYALAFYDAVRRYGAYPAPGTEPARRI